MPCNNLYACRSGRTAEPKEVAKVARWDLMWSQPRPTGSARSWRLTPVGTARWSPPPPGLCGAVVLGVAAQHNVRPREPHFMRAVTALRELDIHSGANYVHTQLEIGRS